MVTAGGAEPNRAPGSPKKRVARAFGIVMAAIAIGYLAYVVPVRDRCVDPEDGAKATLVRTGDTCTLVAEGKSRAIARETCASLTCEPGLASAFGRAKPPRLGLLFLVFCIGMTVTVERWRILLKLGNVSLPFSRAMTMTLESYAVGAFLPGGVGGDAFRVAWVRREHPEASIVKVAASVIIDRVLGFAAMCVIAAGLALTTSGGDMGSVRYVFFVVPPLGVIAGLALRYTSLLNLLDHGPLRRVVAPLREYVKAENGMWVLGRALLLSVFSSSAQLVSVVGLLWALKDWPSEAGWVWVGTVLAFIVSALPGLPGGWGTADATYVYFFGKAGVAPSLALSVSLLVRSWGYVYALAGALCLLARRRTLRRATAEVDP